MHLLLFVRVENINNNGRASYINIYIIGRYIRVITYNTLLQNNRDFDFERALLIWLKHPTGLYTCSIRIHINVHNIIYIHLGSLFMSNRIRQITSLTTALGSVEEGILTRCVILFVWALRNPSTEPLYPKPPSPFHPRPHEDRMCNNKCWSKTDRW